MHILTFEEIDVFLSFTMFCRFELIYKVNFRFSMNIDLLKGILLGVMALTTLVFGLIPIKVRNNVDSSLLVSMAVVSWN